MSLDDVRRQSTTNDMRGEDIEVTGDEVSKFQQSEALVSGLLPCTFEIWGQDGFQTSWESTRMSS